MFAALNKFYDISLLSSCVEKSAHFEGKKKRKKDDMQKEKVTIKDFPLVFLTLHYL